MYTFLIIMFILLSITMVIVILLQAGKGQGLAGAIGGGMGGGTIFGGRGAADFLSKATTWIAALYMIFAILIGMLYKTEAEEAQKSLIEKRVEQQETMPIPDIPVAPLDNQNTN
ncbi:MAG: preprotein translocase subunit SecG [Calditrichaceae bacterium]|nr:preprotein translocase subunit SecG [Calditrichaceae bacterium]